MFSECIEMESRTSSHPSRSRLATKKVLAEEYELRDLPPGSAISCWWMTLPVFYYLAVIAGGVMASISVGDITAAFASNCVLFADINLIGLDFLKNNSKTLTNDNLKINKWGDLDACLFPEYTSVACVMYAGILLVMVLQCGRGGGKSAFRGRGIAESWRIVPVAFVFNLIFLILSSIIFANIQNGFSTFCDGMNHTDSTLTLGNVSSCSEVLQFTFPSDKYNTNLYMEYVLAKIGASLQFGGSLLSFLTIVIRCCLPADFIVYRRRKVMVKPEIQSSCSEWEKSNVSSHGTERVVTTVECHNPHAYENSQNTDDTDSVHSIHSNTNLVTSTPARIKPMNKF